MALATSVGSRFLAKILIIGGLASCPLLLNSEITLAQSASNYRELSCLRAGYRQPYLYGSITWSGMPSWNSAWNSLTLRRFNGIQFVAVDYAGAAGSGASGEIWAIAKSPVRWGWFEGDSFFTSSYGPEQSFRERRICLP